MRKQRTAPMVVIGNIQIPLKDVLDALSDEQIKDELEARDLDQDYKKEAYEAGWNDNDDKEHVEPLLREDLIDLKRTIEMGDLSHLSVLYSRLDAIAQ